MSELQATLEFSVELNKFYNVDLFQRGYYQIRAALKTPPKVPAKIEITLQKSQGDDNGLPAHVVNEMAVSRTFQILYRNEDLTINDVILYRFHTLVDSARMEEELRKLDIQLALELWFSEEQNGLSAASTKSECVSQRQLQLHFSPTKGLHHHVPILFDYFHLSAIEVTVHGTLIAIHQPFLSVPKQPRSAWTSRNPDLSTLETVYFGVRPISADPDQCLAINLHQAWQMHHRICNLLLSAYESLQSTFEMYLSDLAGSQFKLEHIDCHKKLQTIMDNIQPLDNEEELMQNATRDITQLCAANVILWTQFLESASLDQGVIFHLAREHHTARIKRLAEGFFTHEYPKAECLLCYEPSYHGHSDLATMVRSSMYLQTLPPLDVECLELDGDQTSLPIIFEDMYFDQLVSHNGTSQMDLSTVQMRSGSSSPNSSSPSNRSKTKRNLIKSIRPDTFKRPSYSCTEAEASSAKKKKNPKDVMLVGYRKMEQSPLVNRVELGTLSPVVSSTASASSQVPSSLLVNSSSLPTLFRAGWSRNSDGTLPAYVEVARQSLRAKKRKTKSSVITVDFGGSDSQLVPDEEEKEETEVVERGKLKRAYTDPVRHSSTSSSREDTRSSDRPARTSGETPVHQGSSTSSVISATSEQSSDSANMSGHRSSDSSSRKDSDSPAHSGTAKKQLHFQDELYRNLSQCLTQALGDCGNDSDQSDDGTCVQNGYDECLESQPLPFTSKATDSSSADDVGSDRTKADPAQISSDQTPRLTVKDILRHEDLKLGKPSEVKEVTVPSISVGVHDQGMDGEEGDVESARRAVSDMSVEDVLSISDISVPGDIQAGMSQSARTLTESVSSSVSKESGMTLTSVDSGGRDKVTVIELLKEEYAKSAWKDPLKPGSSSISDLSDSGVSGLSGKTVYQKASSDSNILQSVDTQATGKSSDELKADLMVSSASFPELSKLASGVSSYVPEPAPKLVDPQQVGHSTVSFVTMRESLKSKMKYQGNLYSETPRLAATIPYFHVPERTEDENQRGCHLIVCVHGLDGNSADLRLVKTYMEMALPGYRLEFLMSERNQGDTFADFDVMTERLVSEILSYIEMYSLNVARISFIGHSLGNIIIRSALACPDMMPLLPKMYTFLSLSGPHLGTLYNNSGLVNMGMWFMQKWKKSGSLLQLSLKDGLDPRQSFLYRLSQKPGLEFFKHVLLVGSSQDRYVPYHSSRIEMCKAAQRESSGMGSVYGEMVANILQPVIRNSKCKLIRYDVFHALPNTANTIIGRAAHIAVLDSEIFIEKFLMVAGLKYFK